MKYVLSLLTVILFLSCGPAVGVDYNEKVDFSTYNTYNYYPTIESGLSQLDNKRVKKALDSLLQLKGFKKVAKPQLLINFFAKEQVSTTGSSIGIGVGSGGANGGFGVGGGIPIGGNNINQQFTLDFVDAAKDDLIWQAVIDAHYKEKSKPIQKEKYYFTIIEKALKKYPPKTK